MLRISLAVVAAAVIAGIVTLVTEPASGMRGSDPARESSRPPARLSGDCTFRDASSTCRLCLPARLAPMQRCSEVRIASTRHGVRPHLGA